MLLIRAISPIERVVLSRVRVQLELDYAEAETEALKQRFDSLMTPVIPAQ